ncbi:DoxX family protein [Imperialibacter roseus]|uniref:DoxX family protein n=1 Tax=Imperialibacter roseus TaxID=1324217 RepID=A0ABZ0ITT8_9BACT|nr:DoxX family protein [Imperialibacter roseus]WOK08448.1 DoxX family protein [Imperialibacter roseus]
MNLLRFELPSRFHDYGLLVLRLAFGFSLMYGHGWGKMMRLFGPDEIKFADPFGFGPAFTLSFAVFAEVICAILVMAGLFTRTALIPPFITVATAFFTVHFSQEFSQQEKVILFAFAFLALFFTGPGKISLDGYLKNGK